MLAYYFIKTRFYDQILKCTMAAIADMNVWVGQTYTQTVYGSLMDIQKLKIVVLTVAFYENS